MHVCEASWILDFSVLKKGAVLGTSANFYLIIGARDEGTEIEGSGNAGEANSSNDARQRGAD